MACQAGVFMTQKKNPVSRRHETAQDIQDYYDNILSSLIDGIVVVDKAFRITTFSTTAENMMGVKADTVLGKPFTEIFEKESEIHSLVQKTLLTGRSYADSNFSIYGYFGDRHDIGLATSPLIDHDGNTKGVVVVFRDLSQIKSLEERLRKGERLASLGILAAGMAHEIKNPLGGIRGAAQLLREELKGSEHLQDYTDLIVREVVRLNKIVLGLLDFSRPAEIKLRTINLHQILDRVASVIQMEASNQKIKIRRHFDPSLPDVMADPDQLTQVFINLFKNGIDSMESEGTLTLTTRMLFGYQVQSAHEGKKGMVSVDVRDEGCGIDEEDLSKIFDPFYTRKAGGIGLGLALCHRIVEEHRGKIEVKSTPGKGTIFSVCLPIAIQSKSG